MPRFTPECFARVYSSDTSSIKRFRTGLDQLLKEGVAQSFEVAGNVQPIPLLGAVGPLQFEVLQYRLETEYKAGCRIETAPFAMVRWLRHRNPDVTFKPSEQPKLEVASGCSLATDAYGKWVILLPEAWALNFLQTRNEDIEFLDYPVTD